MITTKRQLAEQVLRRISGGDVSDGSEYDIREIIRFIEQAVNALVKSNFYASLKVGETSIGPQYISTFRSLPVEFDTELDLAYLNIPCTYLDLPDDRGVYHISPMKEQHNAFVPVRNGSATLFSHSEANNLEGRIGYWLEQNRVYFNQNIAADGCDKVLLKLVVASPENCGDDDLYPIGSDLELPVIQKVLEIMGITTETDDVNDKKNKK